MVEPIPYPAKRPTSREDMPSEGIGSVPLIWARVGARVIDEVIWAIPTGVAYVATASSSDGLFDLDLSTVPRWLLVVTVIVPLLYEFGCLALWGATFGKWTFGLRVVDVNHGRRPAPYQVGLRVILVGIGSLLTVAVPWVDLRSYLWFVEPVLLFTAAADPLGRGWHDRGAATIVLRSR